MSKSPGRLPKAHCRVLLPIAGESPLGELPCAFGKACVKLHPDHRVAVRINGLLGSTVRKNYRTTQ
jgi:hypothetical protein